MKIFAIVVLTLSKKRPNLHRKALSSMYIRIFFHIQIYFILFLIFFPKLEASKPLNCEVAAPIAVLINAENGKILFAKNAKTICYPASTTKLATALYVLHKHEGSLDQRITASHDALATVSTALRRSSGKHPSYRLEFGGTHMGIKVGEELDKRTLLYGLMLASGNDAANVLAESTSGSVSCFMEELNTFLKEIGCEDTNFTNPHGMPDNLHVTTALDLATMARVARKNSLFREIVSSKKYERPETDKNPASWLIQGNGLVKPGKYFYPHATGLKTGYTVQAGFTLVASAEKGDRQLIAVVCNCDELAKRYRSAIQLFEAGFNEPKQVRKLLSSEHDIFHNKLEGAKEILDATLKEDVIVSFYPSEEQEFHSQVTWLNPLLPIKQGEEVGLLQLFDQEEVLCQTMPLLALKTVYPTFSYQVSRETDRILALIKERRISLGYSLAALLLLGSFLRFHRKKLSLKKIRRKPDELL